MRIVSGKYGGRPLKSLAGSTTRPTSDKVKAAIFNMIGPYFTGGNALDLYAGSGALAIEAISRGCDFAVLVEQNRAAQQIIAENIAVTKESENFRLLKMTAAQALSQQSLPVFDYVFLDPPYAKEQIASDIQKLHHLSLLAASAKIICETDKTVELPDKIENFTKIKEKTYGITKISIYS